MNDKPQLGIIRIVTHTAMYVVPYFAEAEFDQIVVATKAHKCYFRNGLYIPEDEIAAIIQEPMETKTTSEFAGMTRQ